MINEYRKLSSDIKELIYNYTNGITSSAEAENILNSLEEEYEAIIKKDPKANSASSFTDALCVEHNNINFSLFTGIYLLKQQKIITLGSGGDGQIALKIHSILTDNINKIRHSNELTLTPEDDERLKNNLYIAVKKTEKNSYLLSTALTSSKYFHNSTFENIGETIHGIISKQYTDYDYINIYERVKNELININDKKEKTVVLLHFYDIETIFNHMGVKVLLDVSSSIEELIKSDLTESARVLSLSFSDFIVICNDSDVKNKGFDDNAFAFDKIPLSFTEERYPLIETDNVLKVLSKQFGLHRRNMLLKPSK